LVAQLIPYCRGLSYFTCQSQFLFALISGLVLGGIALLESELLAGMAVGAGVTLLSSHLPKITDALRQALKAAVRAAYTAAEVVALTAEEIQDMVAEARAEHEQAPSKEEPQITH